MSKPVTVVCFYTENTPYEQEVKQLQASCERFAIPTIIEGVRSQGSWEKNIAMKPKFILEQLEKSEGPILWVDADGVFLQKPDFSFLEEVDFSVRFMQVFREDPNNALNAATIFVSKTEAAKKLLESWVKRCDELCTGEMPPIVDQMALFDVLLKNKEAKVLPLPVSYCKIFDLDTFFINDDQVIIEQRQASRRYKCDISYSS